MWAREPGTRVELARCSQVTACSEERSQCCSVLCILALAVVGCPLWFSLLFFSILIDK